MCGRFTLSKPPDLLTQHFGIPPGLPGPVHNAATPRYNIAPSQTVLAARVGADAAARELAALQWGLLPKWSRDPASAPRPINARAETLASRPAFREAFRARRCLIPADGFYEWQLEGKRKQAWYIHRPDHELFAFAGLWEQWRDAATSDAIESCALITTTPNELLAPIHDRMPVIVAPEDFEEWLAPDSEPQAHLLRPYPASELRAHRVGTMVGNPRAQGPECCQPLPEASPP